MLLFCVQPVEFSEHSVRTVDDELFYMRCIDSSSATQVHVKFSGNRGIFIKLACATDSITDLIRWMNRLSANPDVHLRILHLLKIRTSNGISTLQNSAVQRKMSCNVITSCNIIN